MTLPSKYKPEYAQMLTEFFNAQLEDALHQSKGVDAGGAEYYNQQVIRFPSIYKFAGQIGVGSSSLQEWAVCRDSDGNLKHPEYAAAYNACLDKLKGLFAEASATGAMKNGNILAANLFGWYSDKTKVDQKTDHGISPEMAALLKLPEDDLDHRLRELQSLAERSEED